jgi:hypothetical protein
MESGQLDVRVVADVAVTVQSVFDSLCGIDTVACARHNCPSFSQHLILEEPSDVKP